MDSKKNAPLCSVCQEIYTDPRSLACGHSFCLQCLKRVAGKKKKFPCPICRSDIHLRFTNLDQLPKNFVLCNVIEAIYTKHQSMCLDHNKLLDLFCKRCDVVMCSRCLTMQHKGHEVEDIEIIYSERNQQLEALLETTKQLASMTQDKIKAVKQSRILMEKNIDSISETVENTFKKWNDALQKQHNAIVSYLHQERDQNRQLFFEAEGILAGAMTTVTELDTEINNLRSKDTAFVVQQYGSIKARQEDTECKILQEIETCFTPPDTLVLEVYAPWIEEAINNIKHIDMKQTKARPVRLKIAEIQKEENFILKREVEYVACLLEELANVSQSTNNGDNSTILSHPENFGSSRDYKTKDGKKTESSQNKPMKSVQNEKLMIHYGNASDILKQIKEKEVLRIDLGKRRDELEDLMVRFKKLQGENIEIKNDADSLWTRLSEHAGTLLTFENRSISNLSDPNRPTELAEMYSELYDNKWTDAFENLEKENPDTSAKTIIGYLYDMLVDGYRFCEEVRQTQKSFLEEILFYPAGGMRTSQRRQTEEISTIFANHLSDAAKLSSNKSSVHMAKAFVRDEKTKDKYKEMIKLCKTYIQECVQLCWLMQVQTPPVCLDLKTIQGQTFDKNCYREYTKKGKKIAFVVWPALFLHENGPLLIKGVAQGQ